MTPERDEQKDKAMTKTDDVRRAHKILARLGKHPLLSKEQENLLRSLLPELPKQKTLTELRLEVWDAWVGADGNEWADDAFGDLETWLYELHEQLQELEHNANPAKPAHPEFLDTEADYEDAPEGTIVAADGGMSPIVKDFVWPMRMSRVIRRRVLRWGNE